MKINELGLKRLMMLRFVFRCLLVVLIITITAWSSHSAASDWKPERNLELIVGTPPGSGTDTAARMIQHIWQAKGIMKSCTVVNKPGGGMSIGLTYLKKHVGNGHYVMLTTPTMLTNYLTGKTTVNYTDFTPLAILGSSSVVVAVGADSPFKTGKDLVAQLIKDPKSLSIGFASARGNLNHMALSSVFMEAGVNVNDLKLVIFGGSSKAYVALMGGHIDVAASGVDSSMQHYQTGKIRPLGITAEKRMWGEYSVVPTWKEQGINVVITDSRIVVGPKGMIEAQTAYWDDVFAKLCQSDEWNNFEKQNLSAPFYLNSKASKKFVDALNAQFKTVLNELGLAK